MPKHIVRLLALLVVLALMFVGGRYFFTPKSFGAYGHYRAASVEEIAVVKPRIIDAASFSAVYPKEYATWSENIHQVVQCQACHMATEKLSDRAGGPAAHDRRATDALPIPRDSLKLCVECHQKIAGRPASMPQIDVVSHTQGKQCTACHNPHSPLFSPAGAPVALASNSGGTGDAAAGKTKSALCAACHGPAGVSAVADFPNLACQKEPYLTGALTAYQSGTRGNPMMGAIAKSLSKADIRNLAAYFAGLSCGR